MRIGKNYKLGFSWRGLIAFLLVMLPNIVWMVVPPASDVLRQNNVEGFWPSFLLNISQFLMVVCLIFCVNRQKQEEYEAHIYGKWAVISLVCYYVLWVLYYRNIVYAWTLVGMAVLPMMFFILVELKLKNYMAILPSLIFAAIHIVTTFSNFVGKPL